jgi:hypothetical protein
VSSEQTDAPFGDGLRRGGSFCPLLAEKGFDGADGARTRDLESARLALSQLSYGPLRVSQFSREIEIVGPFDPELLIVPRRRDPQSNFTRRALVDGKEEAPIELLAVRREGVDLVGRVFAPQESTPCAAARIAADDDDVSVSPSPFALHAPQPRSAVEDQVVPLVTVGTKDADTELDRRECDCRFGDGSFLIRCHVGQPSSRLGWAVSGSDAVCGATLSPRERKPATN